MIHLIFSFLIAVHAQTPPNTIELPKLEWAGDIRYRLAKRREAGDEARHFQELRVRLGLKAEVNEQTKAVIRLATATSAISNNQTLGDANDPGMPRRNFGLDQAYIDWKYTSFGNLWAGRIANPFWAPNNIQIIFDSDLVFEGIGVKLNPTWGEHGAFLNLGSSIISEQYSAPQDVVDIGLVGGDVGYRWKTGDSSLTFHFGNYYFLNIQDKPITSIDAKAAVDAYSQPFDSYRGNSVYPNDPALPLAQRKYYFSRKFVLIEAGTEWKHTAGQFEYSLFYDWVRNTKYVLQGHAHEYGFVVKWSPLWISLAQITKQRDSVVGAFTDSDANGNGTDNRGIRLQFGVQLGKNANFVATHYQAKRGIDTAERNLSLTQLDVSVNF